MSPVRRSKSIEQLENDYWPSPDESSSGLVINCHKNRKIPLRELTNEQLRLLISQKIGIEYLTELALEKLEENVLVEGDIYEGDLLEAVSRIPIEFWSEKAEELKKLDRLVESNSGKLRDEMGEKQFARIAERIKACAQQRL